MEVLTIASAISKGDQLNRETRSEAALTSEQVTPTTTS